MINSGDTPLFSYQEREGGLKDNRNTIRGLQ